MVFIPEGFAHVIMRVQHTSFLRPAAITWGVGTSLNETQAVADAIMTDFLGPMTAQFDSDTIIGTGNVYFGSSTGETLPFTVNLPAVGGRSSAATPPNVAFLVRKFTNLPGRKGRGRLYLPWCLAEANVDELGNVTATETNALNPRLTAWVSAADAAGRPLYLLHKSSSPFPSAILSMTGEGIIGTQRKRLRG